MCLQPELVHINVGNSPSPTTCSADVLRQYLAQPLKRRCRHPLAAFPASLYAQATLMSEPKHGLHAWSPRTRFEWRPSYSPLVNVNNSCMHIKRALAAGVTMGGPADQAGNAPAPSGAVAEPAAVPGGLGLGQRSAVRVRTPRKRKTPPQSSSYTGCPHARGRRRHRRRLRARSFRRYAAATHAPGRRSCACRGPCTVHVWYGCSIGVPAAGAAAVGLSGRPQYPAYTYDVGWRSGPAL